MNTRTAQKLAEVVAMMQLMKSLGMELPPGLPELARQLEAALRK